MEIVNFNFQFKTKFISNIYHFNKPQAIAKDLMLLHVHVYLLLLFQLGGIGLLAYGSYIKNNNGLQILGILTIILEYVHLSFPWLLIMAAIICILVSFLGCCGAVKKFRGMLTMVRFNLVMKSYFANSLVLLIFCSGWGGGGLE